MLALAAQRAWVKLSMSMLWDWQIKVLALVGQACVDKFKTWACTSAGMGK